MTVRIWLLFKEFASRFQGFNIFVIFFSCFWFNINKQFGSQTLYSPTDDVLYFIKMVISNWESQNRQ